MANSLLREICEEHSLRPTKQTGRFYLERCSQAAAWPRAKRTRLSSRTRPTTAWRVLRPWPGERNWPSPKMGSDSMAWIMAELLLPPKLQLQVEDRRELCQQTAAAGFLFRVALVAVVLLVSSHLLHLGEVVQTVLE